MINFFSILLENTVWYTCNIFPMICENTSYIFEHTIPNTYFYLIGSEKEVISKEIIFLDGGESGGGVILDNNTIAPVIYTPVEIPTSQVTVNPVLNLLGITEETKNSITDSQLSLHEKRCLLEREFAASEYTIKIKQLQTRCEDYVGLHKLNISREEHLTTTQRIVKLHNLEKEINKEFDSLIEVVHYAQYANAYFNINTNPLNRLLSHTLKELHVTHFLRNHSEVQKSIIEQVLKNSKQILDSQTFTAEEYKVEFKKLITFLEESAVTQNLDENIKKIKTDLQRSDVDSRRGEFDTIREELKSIVKNNAKLNKEICTTDEELKNQSKTAKVLRSKYMTATVKEKYLSELHKIKEIDNKLKILRDTLEGGKRRFFRSEEFHAEVEFLKKEGSAHTTELTELKYYYDLHSSAKWNFVSYSLRKE